MIAGFGTLELILGYFSNMPARDAVHFVSDRANLARRLQPAGKGLSKAEKEAQARVWLGALDEQLAQQAFLLSDVPTSVDFTAFTMVWYHHSINGLRLADGLDNLHRWFDRMQGFGEGQSQEITGEDALSAARDAAPAAIPDNLNTSPRIGHKIAHKSGGFQAAMNDPVEGVLMGEDDIRLILRRDHPDLGTLHLHFPKLWY